MRKFEIVVNINGKNNYYFWNAKSLDNVMKNINKKLDICKKYYTNSIVELVKVNEI